MASGLAEGPTPRSSRNRLIYNPRIPANRTPITHRSARAVVASQPRALPSHCSQAALGLSAADPSSARLFQCSRWVFSVLPRLGSCTSLATAAFTCSSVGLSCGSADGVAPMTPDVEARSIANASAPTRRGPWRLAGSIGESTAQFLFNIPRFELRAPVQVQCKTRGDKVGLDKADRDRVRGSQEQIGPTRARGSLGEYLQPDSGSLRSEPEGE